MNILDIVPEVGKILDNLISTPEEKRAAELKLREIDIREIEARLGVQREWLGNKSVFVAGAIPMILWMISIVVLFNCVVSPLLAPIWRMPVINLPEWYSGLATTIIIGLFGKKAFDGNQISLGTFFKPAKGSDETHATTEHDGAATTAPTPVKAVATKTPAPKDKDTEVAPPKRTYDTAEDVDTRFAELVEQYSAEKKAGKK